MWEPSSRGNRLVNSGPVALAAWPVTYPVTKPSDQIGVESPDYLLTRLAPRVLSSAYKRIEIA